MNGWHGGLINNISGWYASNCSGLSERMFKSLRLVDGKKCLYTAFATVFISTARTTSKFSKLHSEKKLTHITELPKDYHIMFCVSKCFKYNYYYTFQSEMHSTNTAEKFNDSHIWITKIIRFEIIKTKIQNK